MLRSGLHVITEFISLILSETDWTRLGLKEKKILVLTHEIDEQF